jgi:hypothetical protein
MPVPGLPVFYQFELSERSPLMVRVAGDCPGEIYSCRNLRRITSIQRPRRSRIPRGLASA